MKRKRVGLLAVLLAAIVICSAAAFLLVYNGAVLLNNPSKSLYPVRGVDVSAYQGEIDWPVLVSQDIQFAFIKATEGSGYIDPYFESNFTNAAAANLRIGAYHFFSYDSGGKTQAENFISAVEKKSGMLPPVVDVEFYADKEKNPPQAQAVYEELSVMLTELEAYYGVKPIIYATEKSYKLYIANQFNGYDIWIRNVTGRPTLFDKREWTFWQYTNRERLDGYNGEERFIDMNVYNGSFAEFEHYNSVVK